MLANTLEKFILKHYEPKLAQVGASPDMLHAFLQNLFSPETFVRHFFRLHSYDLGAKDRLEFWNALMSLPDRTAKDYEPELAYIANCDPQQLGYLPYTRSKTSTPVKSGVDASLRIAYVEHNNKRLYFPKGYSAGAAEGLYRGLVEEEGITGRGCLAKSPHCYTSDQFTVDSEDVVMDIGCAEALFALDAIDTAKRVYCFEMLDCWKKPLAATFAPFGDKAKVIAKFVSDKTAGNEIRLDDALLPEDRDSTFFIKMDIEGGERLVLNAARDFLTTHRVKLAVAAYHRQDDADYLSKLLVEMGFKTSFSDGWMLPEINGHKFPYFRRGVIRARNF